jgi:hypothetical protein
MESLWQNQSRQGLPKRGSLLLQRAEEAVQQGFDCFIGPPLRISPAHSRTANPFISHSIMCQRIVHAIPFRKRAAVRGHTND